jgi:hypothetical protein
MIDDLLEFPPVHQIADLNSSQQVSQPVGAAGEIVVAPWRRPVRRSLRYGNCGQYLGEAARR